MTVPGVLLLQWLDFPRSLELLVMGIAVSLTTSNPITFRPVTDLWGLHRFEDVIGGYGHCKLWLTAWVSFGKL